MVRMGTYGRWCRAGMIFEEDVAHEFAASKLGWYWAQPPWPRENPTYAHIPAAAGKRIIVRTWFWDAPELEPLLGGEAWTALYNNPALYDVAVAEMCSHIENFGPQNLHGFTINEEEPAAGYGIWGSLDSVKIGHFIYGHNILYDRMKAIYPSLKIIANPHVLDFFTDAELLSIKMDGMINHTYTPDLDQLADYLGRGMQIAIQKGISKEVYTLIYASPSETYWPSGNPAAIRPAFETAVAAGVPNIGFFASTYFVTGEEGSIIWNDYEPRPELDDWVNPYLHKQEIMALINEYAKGPSLRWLMKPAIVIGIIVGAIAISRRSK